MISKKLALDQIFIHKNHYSEYGWEGKNKKI